MKHDEMDDLMGRALREVDPPPPTPREEMWARIEAQRAADRGRDVIALKPRNRRTWVPWSAAIAATLVLGIGLGRTTMLRGPGDAQPVASEQNAATPGEVEGAVPTAYRLAATQHLERTETLLSSLAVDARTRGPAEVSDWARELLTDTRLLLASPAAEDASTRRLLEDLELVLSQIAGIPQARANQEVELIQDGINQSDVLLRLRAATTGRRPVGT